MDPTNREIQRKPRKGDLLGFGDFTSVPHPDREVYEATGLTVSRVVEPTAPTFVVDKCDGNLCWITPIGGGPSYPFIFRFNERHPSGRAYSGNQLARIFDASGAQIPHPTTTDLDTEEQAQ